MSSIYSRRAYNRKWKLKNKQHVKRYQRRWCRRNREHVNRYAAKRYWENPDYFRESCRRSHHKYKDRRNATRRWILRTNATLRASRSRRERERYWANPALLRRRARDAYDRKYFGGMREIARERAGWRCENCGGKPRFLHTHHLDHDKTNNRLRNLRCLCNRCHGYMHLGSSPSPSRITAKQFYKQARFKKIRMRVHDRAGGRCEVCHKRKRRLEIHHKDRDRLNNRLSNLVVACSKCHWRQHHPIVGKFFK